MISKEEAQQHNLNIVERDIQQEKNEIIEKLKAILPHVINSDDVLDLEALQDIIDLSQTTANNRGYELTFAGKGLAKAKADTPTDKALKVELEQSKNFNNTENVVIRGDNIDVLKLLKQNYNGKIKMIYIDPPYNTKNENFVYNDNFKMNEKELIEEFGLQESTINYLSNVYGTRSHSGWLSFMYPRLKIARDLLRDDGVIFISIDDHEQANLKILCDEIFGEDNFVASFPRITKKAGKTANLVSKNHDYLLCYIKSEHAEFEQYIYNDESYSNIDEYQEERGYYKLSQTLDYDSISYSPSLDYEITLDDKIFRPGNVSSEEMEIRKQKNPKNDFCWRWSKALFNFGLDKGFIVVKNGKRIYTKTYEKCVIDKNKNGYYIKDITRTKSITTLQLLENIYSNDNAKKQLVKMLDSSAFSYSKPTSLLHELIFISTNEDDIILDFFAGSGTTGDAVLQLNAEDGGKRKFILVQWDEQINENKSKTAYDFCISNNLSPVISSITIERLNRAGDKIIEKNFSEKPDLKDSLDIGYKVFSLTPKREIVEKDGTLTIENQHFSTLDKLYNMIVSSSQSLDSKIEEIEQNKIYKINNSFYILDQFTTNQELLKGHRIYLDAYSNISIEDALNLSIVDNNDLIVVY